MAGMPPITQQPVKRKVPPVGEDSNPSTRVANNAVQPMIPDRDGPAKTLPKTPVKPTSAKAKKSKGPDIKGMRKSVKSMGMF